MKLQRKLQGIALSIIAMLGTIPTPAFYVGASAMALTLTACPLTAAQIENEVTTITQEAASIIAVADPGVSWLADFTKASALLKTDEAAWIAGGAVQDVINVLNDIEGITALISPLVPYATLIGVLVAGIDGVLALLLPAPDSGATVATTVRVVAPNPFKGMAVVKSASDSKSQWNAIVAANPALSAAKL